MHAEKTAKKSGNRSSLTSVEFEVEVEVKADSSPRLHHNVIAAATSLPIPYPANTWSISNRIFACKTDETDENDKKIRAGMLADISQAFKEA